MKVSRLLFLLLLTFSIVHGQDKTPKSTGNDNSKATRLLLDTCEIELNKLAPTFYDIPIAISLDQDDYSDNFNWDPPSITIARGFIYNSLDSLGIQSAGKPDLTLAQLDFNHYTNEQIETVLLTVLCHEYGHFLRKLYNDTLMTELGNVHPLLQKQQVEYTCDFISGFMSGKALWRQIRDRLYHICCGNNPLQIIELIKAVDSLDIPRLDATFACLDPFVLPYRKSELLIKYGTDCDHGLGEERKKAFDAGIFFSIYDGIAREKFEDKAVLALLLKLLGKTGSLDETKQSFANNLTRYLIQRKGMNEAVTPVLKAYTGPELYATAFRYCRTLPKKSDGCPIDLHLHFDPAVRTGRQ